MLKPFFSYFGSKWRAAKLYPPPSHPAIVEPFAGSAGYSLRYAERQVFLFDIDPVVCGVWRYLIRTPASEINSLPRTVEHTDDLKGPQELKWLVGFWLSKGASTPRLTPSAWNREWSKKGYTGFWGEEIISRLSRQVESIRHWKVFESTYGQIPNFTATWFIDPPYQASCGRYYRCNQIDYGHLSLWCRGRRGQVTVCEGTSATWLPFQFLRQEQTARSKTRKGSFSEAVWIKP